MVLILNPVSKSGKTLLLYKTGLETPKPVILAFEIQSYTSCICFSLTLSSFYNYFILLYS